MVGLLCAGLAMERRRIPIGVVFDENFTVAGRTVRRKLTSQRLDSGTIRATLTDTYGNGATGSIVCEQADLPRDNQLRQWCDKMAQRLHLPIATVYAAPVVVVRRPIPPACDWRVRLRFEPPNGFRIEPSGVRPVGASIAGSDFITPFERRELCGFPTLWQKGIVYTAPTKTH